MKLRGVVAVPTSVFVALALAGCPVTTQDPYPAPPYSTAAPSPPNDPAGQRLCDAVEAVPNPMAAEPIAMAAAGEAGATSSDPNLATAAEALRDLARLLSEATAAGDEMATAQRRVELANHMSDIHIACSDLGYVR